MLAQAWHPSLKACLPKDVTLWLGLGPEKLRHIILLITKMLVPPFQ